MSRGKQVNCYGLSDLDTTSEETLLQAISHRLKVNLKLCRWLDKEQRIDETVLEFSYPQTISITVETNYETGLVCSYSIIEGNIMGFQYLDIFPTGFFCVNLSHPGDWRIMAADMVNNFTDYNNRHEYIDERSRIQRLCATLGCHEILMMSDYKYDVIEDLEMERSSHYKTKNLQQLLAQLQEQDGVTCFNYAEFLASGKGFNAYGVPMSLTVFYDDFRTI